MAERKTARQIAKEKSIFCEIMIGREKLETEDVLAAGVLTLIDFEIASKGNKDFAVCVFAEDETMFYMAGTVVTDLCKALIKELGEEDYREAVRADNGIPLAFTQEKSTTKGENGMFNTYIKCVMLDDDPDADHIKHAKEVFKKKKGGK